MDDAELLQEYVSRQSEPAFAELVARHVNLVYGTARRVVREPQAAQDVVQAVFIQLARRAWTVRSGMALSGWLYRAAYRTALNHLRGENRRRQREAELVNIADTEPEAWEKLAPLLDEAMQQLSRTEQDLVALRYFEGKSVRETGEALSAGEHATQMRLSRALEKLRLHFARSGVTVSAISLAAILAVHRAEAAPTDLAAKVSRASFSSASSTGLAAFLAKFIFMSTKTKIVLAAAVVVAAIATMLVVTESHAHDRSLPVVATTTPVSIPAPPAVPPRVELPKVAIPANLAVATPGVAPDPTAPSPDRVNRGDLNSVISACIRLLEAQNIPEAAELLLPPDAREHLPPGMTIEQMFQHPKFVEQMTELLVALKTLEGQTPTLNAGGDHATYTLDPPVKGHKDFTFVKIDGNWSMP